MLNLINQSMSRANAWTVLTKYVLTHGPTVGMSLKTPNKHSESPAASYASAVVKYWLLTKVAMA